MNINVDQWCIINIYVSCNGPFQSKELLKKLVLTRQMIQDSVKEHENSFNPKNPSDVIDLYLEEKKTGVKLSGISYSLL